MQNPSSGNQSTASGVPQAYSIYQDAQNVAASQLRNPSNFRGSDVVPKVSQQGEGSFEKGTYEGGSGQTHNLSDQPETTWHWRSQAQASQSTVPSQEPPIVQYVPANGQSFAPPANLGQLQRVERPQVQDPYAGDVYKSPIDQAHSRESYNRVEQLNASDGTNGSQGEEAFFSDDSAQTVGQKSPEQSAQDWAMPQRDQLTEAREFASREISDRPLFIDPAAPSTTAGAGKQLIVLQSQSPQQLADARAKEAASRLPDAQLLTPNFESYVGSPVLDTARDAYQDETQWQVYTPTPKAVDFPPPAVFLSLPEPPAPSIAVDHAPAAVQDSPPTPAKNAFEAAEEIVALPEPTPVPTPRAETSLFGAAPASAADVFIAATVQAKTSVAPRNSFDTKSPETSGQWKGIPVNQVSVASVEPAKSNVTLPSYRFERHETSNDVQANTTAMTVAHSTPVTPPVVADSAWLSPWWMLVCLVPFAMYLVTRRGSSVDECSYAFGEVGDQPKLPREMIERPGYSKSDAIYGESDEFFVTERLHGQHRQRPIAEKIPMATPVETNRHPSDDNAALPAATVTTDSTPVIRFASTNSVQTGTELGSDVSPNFRSKPHIPVAGKKRKPDHTAPVTIKTNTSRKKKHR